MVDLVKRRAALRNVTIANGYAPAEVEAAQKALRHLSFRPGGGSVEVPLPLRFGVHRSWLESRRDKYPYWAKPVMNIVSPVDVDSTGKYGECASAGLSPGERTFAFKTEGARDAFDADMAKFRYREK